MTIFLGLLILLLLAAIEPATASTEKKQLRDSCRATDLGFKWGKRKKAAFTSNISLSPNQPITSNCLILNNISPFITLDGPKQVTVSVDGGDFLPFPTIVNNGSTVQLKATTRDIYSDLRSYAIQIIGDGKQDFKKVTGSLSWTVQTETRKAKSKTWNIGPSYPEKTLASILSKVAPGDTIYLEGNTVYEPITIRKISGTSTSPIKLIGVNVDNKRPVIKGQANDYWALGTMNAHYWHFENIELTNGINCYRHQGHNIELHKVKIHGCGNGILGVDDGSGSLNVSHSEISHNGGKPKGQNWKHGIYMTTDRDRFPNSELLVRNSFLHSNKGNAIKSRAEKSTVIGNWIENEDDKQSIYLLELIGFDGYETVSPINHHVEKNTFIVNSAKYGFRVGGDGTGVSNGTSIFHNNHITISDNFIGYLFRLNGELQSFEATTNTFISKAVRPNVRFIKDHIINGWPNNQPNITVSNNKFNFIPKYYFDEKGQYMRFFSKKFSNIKINNNSESFRGNISRKMARPLENSIPFLH
jgi:hypothetical protein